MPLAQGLRFATGGGLTVPGATVDVHAEVAVEPPDATD